MTRRKRNFDQLGKIDLLHRFFPPNGTRSGHRVLDFFVRLCYDYGMKIGEEPECGVLEACFVAGLWWHGVRSSLFRGRKPPGSAVLRIDPVRSFAPPFVQRRRRRRRCGPGEAISGMAYRLVRFSVRLCFLWDIGLLHYGEQTGVLQEA